MSIGMILKVFSDCCVCFAILGAFPSVFAYSYPLLFPALLCGFSAGLAAFLCEKGKSRLSRACAALPFLSLLAAGGASETIILSPVLLYTAAVILRGHLQLEYYGYRQFFLRSLILVGALYVVLSIFSILEGYSAADAPLIHAEVTLRYGVVYLICGIILQRQLRLGMENRAQGSAGQMAAVLADTGAVILGFLVTEPLLRQGATALFKTALSLALSGVMAVVDLFGSLLDQAELENMNQEIQQHREYSDAAAIGAVPDRLQQILSNQPEAEGRSLWWVALIAILLLGAMALMFLSFRRKSETVRSPETVTAVDMPSREKQSRRSNRARVRQAYRDFLRQEKKRGLRLKKDHTSEDILRRISADTDEKAAAELRELYIRARYDEKGDVSREQVEAAKAALKKSRGGANAAAQ